MKSKVVIVGGGPAGSTAAMYLLREGITPIIVEKESFPRYHVGESMTGECGAVVRDLGLEEEMLKRKFPIKHGVKVFGKNPWFVPVMGRNQDGELFDQFTWQVRRSEFDQLLLNEAKARGATHIEGKALQPILDDDGKIQGVEVRLNDGGVDTIETEFILDCSGSSTFLANAGVTGPKYVGNYDNQIAIFSQVRGGIRDQGEARDMWKDNTLIFYSEKYHWAWWIPLDGEVVSVGVVIPAEYFLSKNESKEEFLKRELLELHPELSSRLPEFELVEEARSIKNYSYQVQDFCGPGYMCLGDSHRFLDPIFSFGLYVAMKEAQKAVPEIVDYLNGNRQGMENPFESYQRHVEQGIDVLEDALDGFWEHPFAFAVLVHRQKIDQMVDVFAGRIYENQPSDAIVSCRILLNRDRDGENADRYSVPIGSRYNPERAPIWVEDPDDMVLLAKIGSS